MFNRLNRVVKQALDPDKVGNGPHGRQPTLDTLLAGDVASLWDGGDCVVESVLECAEELNGRDVRWRWCLVDQGRLIETAPDGNVYYGRSVVFHQDSAEFETLTTSPEQGGVLKSFEERVRLGNAARNPTLFEYQGRVYRMVSTGIFSARMAEAQNLQQAVAYPSREVWRDIHPTQAGENVYFELEPTDEENEAEMGVLGIWTTHIVLYFGRTILGVDVQSIYPRSDESRARNS